MQEHGHLVTLTLISEVADQMTKWDLAECGKPTAAL